MTEPVTPKLSDAPMTRFHEMAGGEIISAQGLVVCTVNVCELRTDEAQRLRAAVKQAEHMDQMQQIGRQVLAQMVADAESQIVVLEGRG